MLNRLLMRFLINLIRPILHTILPKNRTGDKIYSFINFIINHRGRFPRNRMLFNDYMYKIKTSNEIVNPLRVFITDKEFAKIYIRRIVGDEFNVPTLKILRSYKEVLKYKFPSQCVIKPTHMSGHIIIKKEEDEIDLEKIKKWFSMNFYDRAREANYKTLVPKIIVEEIIFNEDNLADYKFFCYKGVPKLIQVDIDRNVKKGVYHKRKFLNTFWIDQNYSILYPRYEKNIDKPTNLNSMLSAVTKIAKSTNLDFLRIDTYTNNQKLFIGELTNIHGNAAETFYPSSGELAATKIIFE